MSEQRDAPGQISCGKLSTPQVALAKVIAAALVKMWPSVQEQPRTGQVSRSCGMIRKTPTRQPDDP